MSNTVDTLTVKIEVDTKDVERAKRELDLVTREEVKAMLWAALSAIRRRTDKHRFV